MSVASVPQPHSSLSLGYFPTIEDTVACQITSETMTDPVIGSCGCGISFERVALINWLSQHATCPSCRNPSSATQLTTNRTLKHLTEALKEPTTITAERIFETIFANGSQAVPANQYELAIESTSDETIKEIFSSFILKESDCHLVRKKFVDGYSKQLSLDSKSRIKDIISDIRFERMKSESLYDLEQVKSQSSYNLQQVKSESSSNLEKMKSESSSRLEKMDVRIEDLKEENDKLKADLQQRIMTERLAIQELQKRRKVRYLRNGGAGGAVVGLVVAIAVPPIGIGVGVGCVIGGGALGLGGGALINKCEGPVRIKAYEHPAHEKALKESEAKEKTKHS